jgi:hypothetical protein
MDRNPVIVNLVKKQTELFNSNAPEIEKVQILKQIMEYQKKK